MPKWCYQGTEWIPPQQYKTESTQAHSLVGCDPSMGKCNLGIMHKRSALFEINHSLDVNVASTRETRKQTLVTKSQKEYVSKISLMVEICTL